MSQLAIPTVSNEIPPHITIIKMLSSYWISQSIYAVAKLGISDLLKDGSQSCEELAKSTNMNPRALYRLMRALASIGIFVEQEQSIFALTPLAACLQSDVPNSTRDVAIVSGKEGYQAWGDILYSIETGDSAFTNLYQMNLFEYFAQKPEIGKRSDAAMTTFSAGLGAAITASYDFSSIHRLVDVAGGQGSIITSILKANPTMQGVLFDQESVIEGAKPLIEAEGYMERCQLVAGNFFESVPKGGDIYILKSILHDWDDERSIKILKNCHSAMSKNTKLLVIEQVIPPGNDPFQGKWLDLNMLINCPGGCERTKDEYETLFAKTGFQLTKIVQISSEFSIIEGIRH